MHMLGRWVPWAYRRTTAWDNAVTLSSMFFMCPHMFPPSGPHYLYTWDLWALHWQPRWVTPATVGVLSSHLDRLFVEYVIPGLEQGFCIGVMAHVPSALPPATWLQHMQHHKWSLTTCRPTSPWIASWAP